MNFRVANVFALDWQSELRSFPEPIWIVGNPPWVTMSKLGALEGNNQPPRQNVDALPGLQARTGAANFDMSEWLLRKWLEALQHRCFLIAVICKAQVARRVLAVCAREKWPVRARLYHLDARQAFGVTVGAVWLVIEPAERSGLPWAVHDDLEALFPHAHMSVEDGQVIADAEGFAATIDLHAESPVPWRSGVKHDAADVMELRSQGGSWRSKLQSDIQLEPQLVFPLLKGTDLFHGRTQPERALLLPQRALGAPTAALQVQAPLAWAYLQAHHGRFEARRSRIYTGQPAFAVFGVGPYTFAPWKVAISGLHASPRFRVVGPCEGRPVVFDDTCYFLPCASAAEAHSACDFLNGERAQRFLRARSFTDAKRPVTQRLLAQLRIAAWGQGS